VNRATWGGFVREGESGLILVTEKKWGKDRPLMNTDTQQLKTIRGGGVVVCGPQGDPNRWWERMKGEKKKGVRSYEKVGTGRQASNVGLRKKATGPVSGWLRLGLNPVSVKY